MTTGGLGLQENPEGLWSNLPLKAGSALGSVPAAPGLYPVGSSNPPKKMTQPLWATHSNAWLAWWWKSFSLHPVWTTILKTCARDLLSSHHAPLWRHNPLGGSGGCCQGPPEPFLSQLNQPFPSASPHREPLNPPCSPTAPFHRPRPPAPSSPSCAPQEPTGLPAPLRERL